MPSEQSSHGQGTCTILLCMYIHICFW